MTSGGSFHLCEDRKPSWWKPSPEIVFLCHSAISSWLYILPEPGPQPCHIPMLPALQAGEGHPPCQATPTSDVMMAAHLSLWRDGGQWHSTKATWKLNFYSWSQKSSSRSKAWGKGAPGSFSPNKDSGVSWMQGVHHCFLCWSCGKELASSLCGRKVPAREGKPVTPPRKLIAGTVITL